MKYLAVGFWSDSEGGDTFSLSRETDCTDVEDVCSMLCDESQMGEEEMNTILLLKNGTDCPEVVSHWSAQGGDFEYFLGDDDD